MLILAFGGNAFTLWIGPPGNHSCRRKRFRYCRKGPRRGASTCRCAIRSRVAVLRRWRVPARRTATCGNLRGQSRHRPPRARCSGARRPDRAPCRQRDKGARAHRQRPARRYGFHHADAATGRNGAADHGAALVVFLWHRARLRGLGHGARQTTPGCRSPRACALSRDVPFSHLTTYVPAADRAELFRGRPCNHAALQAPGAQRRADQGGAPVCHRDARRPGCGRGARGCRWLSTSCRCAVSCAMSKATASNICLALYRPDMFRLEMPLTRVGQGAARHWEPAIGQSGKEG